MKLSEIRNLLKRAGIKSTAPVDRISVKYDHGDPVGIDVMLANGDVTYISAKPTTTGQ